MLRVVVLFACIAIAQPAFAQAIAPDGGRVTAPELEPVDPGRFGDRPADEAYGAYQRGYYLTALRTAMPLALNGDPAAQTLIAEIYSRGLGVRPDTAVATEWYEKAAAQQVPEAMFQLAMILLDGGEEFGDADRASAMMQRAADAGHRMAQFNFAQMTLASGQGRSGVEQAIRYYQLAADAGLPDAQYAMAQIRLQGAGGNPPDEDEARRWLEAAARKGHDTAQIDLGTWLVENSGNESGQQDGFAWLMRAASAGNPAAQNRVAKLYRAGVGVEPDRVQAASWYMRARRSGLVDPVMEDQLHGMTEQELRLATLDSDRLR